MTEDHKTDSHLHIHTFGDMLKYLRRRARLTQRELSMAVGYSEAHISRLENNQRAPDLATITALFIPALGLEHDSTTVRELLELAVDDGTGNTSRKMMITQSVTREVTESVHTLEIPSNLPLQLTSFIGRASETREIAALLERQDEAVRLLTLVGAGGCGKTRLAIQVCEKLVQNYPHGVWFIDLAPLTSPQAILRATASLIGMPESNNKDQQTNLLAYLLNKKTLIVFDNCEHVIESIAMFCETLLRHCPQVQALATTRELLNIPGERQYNVAPLTCPPDNTNNANELGAFDSVKLFVQRAENILPSFALTEENASFVASICRRLDGIPLALELAAARVGLLTVRQIEEQLSDRFTLLTSGNRALPRHRTLRAMLDWSHSLLSEDEQRLFRNLAVFAGGWTLDAAIAIQNQGFRAATLDLLSQLVNKSFIVAQREPGSEVRYIVLETLREYAHEKLELAGETRAVRERHFEYFYNLSQKAILHGSDKGTWLDILEAEKDNIRAALGWSYANRFGQPEVIEKMIKLMLSILDFYWYRGYFLEGREWMDRFLEIEMPPSPLRAMLLQKAGWFALEGREFERADRLLNEGLEMALQIGDKDRASWALSDLGLSARDQGDNQKAISLFTEALAFARQSENKRSVGSCLYYLAGSLDMTGDINASRRYWQEGLNVFIEESDKIHIAWGLEGLAGTEFLLNNLEHAQKLHIDSLKVKVEVMDRLGIAYSFEGLAQTAAAQGENEYAAVLWGVANQLREKMNIPPDPSRANLYTSLIPKVREIIGDQEFETAWKKGNTMKLDEAIKIALR